MLFFITGPSHSQSSNIVLSDNAAYAATTAGDITTEKNESYGTAEFTAPHWGNKNEMYLDSTTSIHVIVCLLQEEIVNVFGIIICQQQQQ